MSAKMHTEGRQWLLEVLFSEEQTVPAKFYVGLCTDADLTENASLGDQTELGVNSGEDQGYARDELDSDNVDWTSASSGTNDRKTTSAVVSFSNTGSSGHNWNSAKTWFLATSSDDSGKLICSGPVNSGSGYVVGSGQTYEAQIKIEVPQS